MQICICVYLYLYVCAHVYAYIITGWRRLIGSPKLQIISTKEPLNIGLFCWKRRIKIRDPTSLRHPVRIFAYWHAYICMCMCVYMYVYVCILYVCIYKYIHIGILIYMYIYTHVCTYIYIYIYIYMYIFIYTCMYKNTYTWYTHIIHTCIYVHIYIYVYIHFPGICFSHKQAVDSLSFDDTHSIFSFFPNVFE